MNKPKAYLSGLIYFSTDTVDTKFLEKDLHIIEDKTELLRNGSKPSEIKLFSYEDIGGKPYIGIPRVYAETYMDNYDLVDWTAEGEQGCLSDLREGVPRPNQVEFIEEVYQLLVGYGDVAASAYTGAGKCFMGIEIARRLNTSTLVIVDQRKLGLQWEDTLIRLFDMELDQIGQYHGTCKDYEGKPVCIATIQTLYRMGDELDEFCDTFGLTIVDEFHSAGSPMHGRVLARLSSKYRLAVSATPDRMDLFQKVLDSHFGSAAYIAPNKHKKSSIRYVEYPRLLSTFANRAGQSGTYESLLSEDGERNLLIANLVKRMYDEGKDILVISSRSVQLHSILAVCTFLGIPEKDMGVYSGTLYKAGYSKDKEPPFRLDEWDGKSFYTSVKYGIEKVTDKKEIKRIQDKAIQAKIIFSTYQMFGKGTDVPRLSVGIDATPRAKVVQAHGRILRIVKDKAASIWITIRDFNNLRAEGQFLRRLGDYAKSNAQDIQQWDLQKGLRTVNVVELKQEVQRNLKLLNKQSSKRLSNGEYELIQTPKNSKPAWYIKKQ